MSLLECVLVTDDRLPEGFWMLQSAGDVIIGSHRYQPERFYEALGFVRAPWERRFAHRLRSEASLGLRVVDANSLRERLYRVWRERQLACMEGHRVPVMGCRACARRW